MRLRRNTLALSQRLFKKAQKLTPGFPFEDIFAGTLYGAYTGEDDRLVFVEFFMHECAHLLAVGQELKELPYNLAQYVTDLAEKFSSPSSDRLEIDAACITYLAGNWLRLWDGPEYIQKSCKRNLSYTFEMDEFDDAWELAINTTLNRVRAVMLQNFIHDLCLSKKKK